MRAAVIELTLEMKASRVPAKEAITSLSSGKQLSQFLWH